MRRNTENREDRIIADILRSNRTPLPGLSDTRVEFERRRLMARVAADSNGEAEMRFPFMRRPGLQPVVFAAVAGFAMALLLFMLFPLPIGENSNDIVLQGEWQLKTGDALSSGARVEVPATGHASLRMQDGTMAWMAPGSEFAVTSPDGAGMRIDAGRALLRVAKQKSGTSFQVEVNGTVIQVLGTVFSVDASGENVEVKLYEGRVHVSRGSRDMILLPGNRVVVSSSGSINHGEFGPSDLAADAQLGGMTEEELGKLAARSGAARFPTSVAATDAASAVSSSAKMGSADDIHGKTDLSSSHGRKRTNRLAAVKKLFESHLYNEILELTEKSGKDVQLGYYRAKALCGVSRWKECAEQYLVVARGNDARKGEATYLSAVAFGRAREYTRGEQQARETISLGGPNADHAWRLLMNNYLAVGRYGDATRSAREYLGRYPAGAHLAEAHFTVASGARLGNRWSEAATAYGKFLARRTGSHAMRDDASFYYGYSILRTGKLEAGRKAVQSYLAGFPGGRHVEQARKILAE